jgi:hypothetical protein
VLFFASIAVGFVVGWATRGSFANVGNIRFRWPWLVVAALLVRGATLLTPLRNIEGIQYVYLASLAAVLGWMLWNVNRVRGIWLAGIGTALNVVVIAANGARMPVSAELAGPFLVQRGHLGQYALMAPGTHLNWLADWIALPGPFKLEAYSPGDLILAVGTAVVIVLAMRSQTGLDETSRRIVSDPP